MKLEQTFTIDRDVEKVWAAFLDVPAMAACLPGAEYLGSKGEGKHAGKVTSKIGPFQVSFEGEADIVYDEAARSIAVDGKGVDRKGNSRGRMTMTCTLAPDGTGTTVNVVSDMQLSGTIAQFGRTGLITEVANVLVADFVRNVEATMPVEHPPVAANGPDELPAVLAAGASAPATNATAAATRPGVVPLSGWRLFTLALKSWLRRLFGSDTSSSHPPPSGGAPSRGQPNKRTDLP